MIERVAIAETDLALEDVLAAVTIRHGRGAADDPPLASTATLTLVNVTREVSSSFSVADALEVYLADDVPRFVGRITDAALTDAGLSIIAVSSLSWLSGRTIGLEDWPEEPWSDRVARAFLEAGYAVTWEGWIGTWADAGAATWAEPVENPPVTIEVGDADPLIAARPAEEVKLGAYLATLAESEPAAIANLPNGNVIVQALSARKTHEPVALDPLAVAYAPEWTMVDDVRNLITVEYDGGTVIAQDPASIARFGDVPRERKITTELALEADAITRAALALAREALPDWLIADAELLELEDALTIGDPVVLSELPSWAPQPSYVGLLEGWEDHVEKIEGVDGLAWNMRLTLSAPRLSGVGLQWAAIPAAEVWADAGAATWAEPETILTT